MKKRIRIKINNEITYTKKNVEENMWKNTPKSKFLFFIFVE